MKDLHAEEEDRFWIQKRKYRNSKIHIRTPKERNKKVKKENVRGCDKITKGLLKEG